MKTKIDWASNFEGEENIEINSLEDLKALYDKERHSLIVRFFDDEIRITVYDAYIE